MTYRPVSARNDQPDQSLRFDLTHMNEGCRGQYVTKSDSAKECGEVLSFKKESEHCSFVTVQKSQLANERIVDFVPASRTNQGANHVGGNT